MYVCYFFHLLQENIWHTPKMANLSNNHPISSKFSSLLLLGWQKSNFALGTCLKRVLLYLENKNFLKMYTLFSTKVQKQKSVFIYNTCMAFSSHPLWFHCCPDDSKETQCMKASCQLKLKPSSWPIKTVLQTSKNKKKANTQQRHCAAVFPCSLPSLQTVPLKTTDQCVWIWN